MLIHLRSWLDIGSDQLLFEYGERCWGVLGDYWFSRHLLRRQWSSHLALGSLGIRLESCRRRLQFCGGCGLWGFGFCLGGCCLLLTGVGRIVLRVCLYCR